MSFILSQISSVKFYIFDFFFLNFSFVFFFRIKTETAFGLINISHVNTVYLFYWETFIFNDTVICIQLDWLRICVFWVLIKLILHDFNFVKLLWILFYIFYFFFYIYYSKIYFKTYLHIFSTVMATLQAPLLY
jgi:hypothetical protein